MASVDYMKVKTRAHLYNLIDHCSTETRLEGRHRNKHIDLTQTAAVNDQAWDAETSRERFRARIAELDATTNKNKRKDRVEAFALEVKPPDGIPLDRQEIWLEDVYELMEGRLGADNVIGAYIHADEIHEYRDARTGLKRMSRMELHLLAVPEVKGQLNGRKFSSPSSMRAMNKAIDKMTLERYGVSFLSGKEAEGIPYGTSTADLKAESEIVQAVLDEHNGLMKQERDAAALDVAMERAAARDLRAEVELLEERAGTIITDAMDAAKEIGMEAVRDVRAVKRDADDYAYRTRRKANKDAIDTADQADRDAEATREAARQEAKEIKAQAERDAQVTRDAILRQAREDAKTEAKTILDAAKEDARAIRQQASMDAKTLKQSGYEDGYAEGEAAAKDAAEEQIAAAKMQGYRDGYELGAKEGGSTARGRLAEMVAQRAKSGPTAVEGPTMQPGA